MLVAYITSTTLSIARSIVVVVVFFCQVISGGFRGGALGASAPPAESMVKNLNLPFFDSMYSRYLFACSVSFKSQHPKY